MIKRIKVNLDVVEAMLYYWQATSEKEKVGEPYILSIADFQKWNIYTVKNLTRNP